jgi:hypothetical protein
MVLVAAGCGSDVPITGGVEAPTPATEYVTLPPPTTTLPPPPTVPPEAGDVIIYESRYVTVSGDFPFNVAFRFQVNFEEMVALNGWTIVDGTVPEWPPAGTEIRIPAGAVIPDTGGAAGTLITLVPNTTMPPPPPVDPNASIVPDSTVEPGPTSCGTYTVAQGDVPLTVAEALGTTVDDLAAVNAATQGYAAFFIGLVIQVPC